MQDLNQDKTQTVRNTGHNSQSKTISMVIFHKNKIFNFQHNLIVRLIALFITQNDEYRKYHGFQNQVSLRAHSQSATRNKTTVTYHTITSISKVKLYMNRKQ